MIDLKDLYILDITLVDNYILDIENRNLLLLDLLQDEMIIMFYIDFCNYKNIPVPAPSAHEDLEFSGKVTLRMSKTLHKLVYIYILF